jgi:hypothetical protein
MRLKNSNSSTAVTKGRHPDALRRFERPYQDRRLECKVPVVILIVVGFFLPHLSMVVE